MSLFKLNETIIKNSALSETPYHLSDGAGLYLNINKTSKRFRFRYKRPITGKYTNIMLGRHPLLSLKKAREIAQEYRELLLSGKDPAIFKSGTDKVFFDDIAQSFFKKMKHEWSDRHYKTSELRYNNYIQQPFKNRDANQITSRDVFILLEAIANSGSYQTAEKISYLINGIFKHGVATGLVANSPAHGILSEVPKTSKEKPMPHFNLTKPGEEERFASFLKDLYSLQRTKISIKNALMFAPHVFLRTGNLSTLKKEYFIEDEDILLIPAADMKSSHDDFIVPLSRQAKKIIQDTILLTGSRKYIFPGKTKSSHVTSEGLSKAKNRTGWKYDDITLHGLRHTAATYLTEQGYDYEVVELQLHHKLQGVRGVYNKAVHLDKRREMMQFWSDYIDSLLEK